MDLAITGVVVSSVKDKFSPLLVLNAIDEDYLEANIFLSELLLPPCILSGKFMHSFIIFGISDSSE